MRLVIACVLGVAFAAAGADKAWSEILITVDKSAQRMTVKRDGQLLYTWPVSTGRSGYATPSGSYTAFRMEAEHYSEEWDDAPMPHSIFFTKIGHAIHGSYDTKNIGRPVSHGCVRLSPANAEALFALVEQEGVTKTKVALTGSEQVALARRGGDTARAGGNVYQSGCRGPTTRMWNIRNRIPSSPAMAAALMVMAGRNMRNRNTFSRNMDNRFIDIHPVMAPTKDKWSLSANANENDRC
jgi:L,D-transpeptidase-like protein